MATQTTQAHCTTPTHGEHQAPPAMPQLLSESAPSLPDMDSIPPPDVPVRHLPTHSNGSRRQRQINSVIRSQPPTSTPLLPNLIAILAPHTVLVTVLEGTPAMLDASKIQEEHTQQCHVTSNGDVPSLEGVRKASLSRCSCHCGSDQSLVWYCRGHTSSLAAWRGLPAGTASGCWPPRQSCACC